MNPDPGIANLAATAALPVLAISACLALIRLLRGPSLPDRVVALDLITVIGIGIISVAAIATGTPVLLDVAIVLALVSFVGTVALARYVERRY